MEINGRSVDGDITLKYAGDLASGLAAGAEADAVEVIDDDLRDGGFAGAVFDVAEGIAFFAERADVEALADDDDAAAVAGEGGVDVVGERIERVVRFWEIELEREPAIRIAEACGGGDKAGFAAHGLVDGDTFGRAHAGVFFVGVLDEEGPEARGAAVAGRVIN